MNTTQCRLCLAHIPHNYNHSSQVTGEKGEIVQASTKSEFKETGCPDAPRRNWPDNNALVAITFLVMVGNLALLLTRLILLDILEACANSERGTGLIIGIYIVIVIAFLGNSFVAVLARRNFNSKWITLYGASGAGIWATQLMRTLRDTSFQHV